MFLILVGVLLVTLIYYKVIKPYSYWKDKGVKQRKQTYLLGDNAGVLFRTETFMEFMNKLYTAFPNERYVGMYQFTLPMLFVRDPDLIKQMAVKDFDHFVDHRPFVPEGADQLWNKNLSALKGNRWRDMRSTLSPSFTTSKMKAIFSLVNETSDSFIEYFSKSCDKKIIDVELKDVFTRYTNDVIANVAFGVKCNSLEERKNEFYVMGKAINFNGFWRNMIFFAYIAAPQLCKMLGITLFPKNVSHFFTHVIKENIKEREEKGIVRPDMIHLLLEARKGRTTQEQSHDLIDTGFATVEEVQISHNHKIVKEEITDSDITSQALVFFFAGFDSVSTLMCFMGYELAVNPDIQKKLQNEIDETLIEYKGKMTYEALMKMKYMDMVVSETLRKWPVALVTDRLCVKPYTIKPVNPTEKTVHLDKGDLLMFPIGALHYDPQYFPKPEVFDPERFNDENKHKIKPYTYLPFGVGPRNCIGSRFALLETKGIFANLLSKFDIVPTEKTQIPLKLKKIVFNILVPEKGFSVGFKPR